MPRLSVIIPVKNGAVTLSRCLQSITDQTIANELEIIVLDSMSTDGSQEIAMQFNARIIDVPTDAFNHGLTRNTGVEYALGDFVYLTVQDAWIPSNYMLERMLSHFEEGDIVAVGGHQAVPHEKDKNPSLWYRPVSSPQTTVRVINDKAAFHKLPDQEQQALVSWDNVVAMYRRTALIKQPFVKTAFTEDWVWSYNALLNGWKLVYDSSLIVYHYHHQLYAYTFNNCYTKNFHFYKFFRYKPVFPSVVLPLVKVSYHLMKNKDLTMAEKAYWIKHNLFLYIAVFFSTINFMIRFKIGGEDCIQEGYNKYCKSIPQGMQKSE